jgi:tetraacyldisaccharide 4'-kinase
MLTKLRLILYPIAIVYVAVVWVRNLFFEMGWFPSKEFDLPVISVGNITVGGTGKTPHTEYLVRLLQNNYALAMISRGYLRQTKGVQVASIDSSSLQVGDEPLQLKKKFPELHVVVAEKRVAGIETALTLYPSPKVVLLDDAFQHRHVKPGMSIVLIDYNRPVWNDHLLPAGNLREALSGLSRAHIVILTKCPENLSNKAAEKIKGRLNLNQSQSLYFTCFSYGIPYPLYSQQPVSDHKVVYGEVVAFTAIANAVPFHNYLKGKAANLSIIDLPDHHRFNTSDIENLLKLFRQLPQADKWIAVTEKDAVKLREIKQLPPEIVSNVHVIPIEPLFLFSQKNQFDKQIIEYVGKS